MEANFLKVAKQAGLEAGKIISQYSGKKHQFKFKNQDKSDFATQADIESEQKIIEILTKNLPEHNIIAEESGKLDKKSKYTWVIDPVDGTFSFVAGIPYYSVSIGLLINNQPYLGVIYNVSMKKVYWAEKSKGAYLNGKKIHVSQQSKLEEAATGLDFGHRQKRQSKIDKYVTPLITKVGYPYSFGSAVASLSLVAEGVLDVYVNQAWIWDFVAGAIIIREAGGKISDFAGQEPDWSKDRLDIIASNGVIHEQVIKELV